MRVHGNDRFAVIRIPHAAKVQITVLREIPLISDSKIQRQILADLPGISSIDSNVRGSILAKRFQSIVEVGRVRKSEQVIGEPITGVLSVETESSPGRC